MVKYGTGISITVIRNPTKRLQQVSYFMTNCALALYCTRPRALRTLGTRAINKAMHSWSYNNYNIIIYISICIYLSIYIQWRSKESCHLRNVIKWCCESSVVGALEKSLNDFEYARK